MRIRSASVERPLDDSHLTKLTLLYCDDTCVATATWLHPYCLKILASARGIQESDGLILKSNEYDESSSNGDVE